MNSKSITSVYDVKAIKVTQGGDGVTWTSQKGDGLTWTSFVFTDSAGGEHEFTAYCDGPVAVEGAEFVNFVAEEA